MVTVEMIRTRRIGQTRYKPGDEVTLPAAAADHLIALGDARQRPSPGGGKEQAIKTAPEKAIQPPAQPRTGQVQPVTAVPGIGEKTARSLAKAGIETLADLAAADVAELDDLLERAATAEKIEQWQEAARVLLVKG